MRKLLSMFVIWSILAAQGFAARSFNGTTEGAQITSMNIGSATAITIAFWLLETSFGSGDHLAMETTANYNFTNGAFLIDTGGACGAGTKFSFSQHQASGAYRARGFTQPSSGVWHHYAFTMSTTSANWAAYVDGVAQTLTNCDVGTPGTQAFVTANNCLMSRGCSGSLWNAGSMAQVAAWTVSLSGNEIQSLASCTEPWQIQAESLAAYAPFWGVDSPEPSFAILQNSGSVSLNGTSFASGPPNCPLM